MKEYTYNIINDVYNWMISKKKNIEVRILKEKSQAIQVGDIITFNNQDSIGEFVKVKVVNKTIVNNLQELLDRFDVERMMPGHSEEELVELMNTIYGSELNNNQIVAFEFEYISSDKENWLADRNVCFSFLLWMAIITKIYDFNISVKNKLLNYQ